MRRVFVVLTCASIFAATPPAARAEESCQPPGRHWGTASPEAVDLDEAKLEEALDWARPRNSQEIAVYRHGCLVAERRWFEEGERYESYSMAKSVTAMAVGRAVTLELLDLDDPIGRYVPDADEKHARITVTDLST